MRTRMGTLMSYAFLGAGSACYLLGAGVTVADVALRALAGRNVHGAIELTSYSIGLGALLSMPVCYAERSHVTAKLLSELRPGVFARPLGLVGALGSAGFTAILCAVVVADAVARRGSPQTSPDLGLPVPALLAVTGLALAAAAVAALAGLWAEWRAGRV